MIIYNYIKVNLIRFSKGFKQIKCSQILSTNKQHFTNIFHFFWKFLQLMEYSFVWFDCLICSSGPYGKISVYDIYRDVGASHSMCPKSIVHIMAELYYKKYCHNITFIDWCSKLQCGFNVDLWEAPSTFPCGNVDSKTQMWEFHPSNKQTSLLFTLTFVLWRWFEGLSPTRPVP